MVFGLFRKKVKVVTVKRKKKGKKAGKIRLKKPKRAYSKSKLRKKVSVKKLKKPKSPKVKKLRQRIKRPSATRRGPAKAIPQPVGKITHYFPHVKAGVISVTNGTISLGDVLRIKGHTTDFKQKVNSMQINNVPIKEAKPGDEIGLLVKSRVRHNDVVYKLKGT